MLKVAARIAAGEWRGFVFGMGEEGEVVDVRWDWSDDHDLDEGAALEGWSDADFDFTGNSLGVRGRKKTRASFAAADLSRPARLRGNIFEYQDPWATSSEDQDHDQGSGQPEDDDPSRSWGVD